MKKLQRRQSGFSLIELLIANFLGLLILIALVQIYLSIKTTYQLQHALVTIQENGRFSIYLLNQQIRMAGYGQCENQQSTITNAIYGYDSNHLPEFLLQNRVVKGTDVIVIQRCGEINNKEKLLTKAYFVANTLQKNQIGQPIYGLYEKIFSNDGETKTQEVASGVENLQVEFGLSDHNNDIETYKKIAAMQKTDWEKIRSVQIALLLNSIDNVLKKPNSYYFNQQLVLPKDRMLHKEWDTYIALRERS